MGQIHYSRERVMRCERCNDVIPEEEERELYGQVLCEDCYLDLLSPLKACDPWVVHSAESFSKDEGYVLHLNENQQRILNILREKGPTELKALSGMLRMKQTDLDRELAVLRHMEKVKGELRSGKRMIRLW
jgi:hypothetical protein